MMWGAAGGVPPRPPPWATLRQSWGARLRLHSPPPSGQAVLRHLHRPQISSRIKDFLEYGQTLVIFFQIVWAWQVPSCPSPSCPSSYNLKKKKTESKTAEHQKGTVVARPECQNRSLEKARPSRASAPAPQLSASFYS